MIEKQSRTAGPRQSVFERVARLLVFVLFLLALPATLILGAVRFAFSWQPVYTYAVQAYHADQVTGIPTGELLQATSSIRHYFTNSQRDLNITVRDSAGRAEPLFNERELTHMRDVKSLVQRVYRLLDVAAAYVVLYLGISFRLRRPLRALAWDVLRASCLSIAILVAFGAASLLGGFDQLFTEFHMLSFSNDFWQLDPARDHLVQMFPLEFWLDITMFVAGLALLAAALILLISLLWIWKDHPTGAADVK